MCSNEIIFAILHFSGSNEIHGKEKKYDQRMLDQTKLPCSPNYSLIFCISAILDVAKLKAPTKCFNGKLMK